MKYIFEGLCLSLCIFLCACSAEVKDDNGTQMQTVNSEVSQNIHTEMVEISTDSQQDSDIISLWNLKIHLTKISFI